CRAPPAPPGGTTRDRWRTRARPGLPWHPPARCDAAGPIVFSIREASRPVTRVSLHCRRPPRVYYRYLRYLLVIVALLPPSAARPPLAGAQIGPAVYASVV